MSMPLPGKMKKRGSVASLQHIWTQQQQPHVMTSTSAIDDRSDRSTSNVPTITIDVEQHLIESSSFASIDEDNSEDQNDTESSETVQLIIPQQRRHKTLASNNTSLSSMADKTGAYDSVYNKKHINDHKITNTNTNTNTKYPSPPITTSISSTNILPLHHNPSPPTTGKDVQPLRSHTTATTAGAATATVIFAQTKVFQLFVGVSGIYAAYLYYGVVQEDLFRYRSTNGTGFSFVWALQVLESGVTMIIGFIGRKLCGGRKNLPLIPFFHSGVSQLAAKALMSLSLAAGLSFPVVVLAKSAKIVPVMIGQLLLGGSKYTFHDYLFAIMIVAGTSLLSAGNTSEHVVSGSDTFTGLILITLSLTADGFTGGLQKKLKRVTSSMAPTTYDFLFYSHVAQFCAAIVICVASGEVYTAPSYLIDNPKIWWWIAASCMCSAIGQCFIFYVISCFDPVVCTTITTTRKMLTVMFSISFKGHHLSNWGCIGLGLAISALLLEVEVKYSKYRLLQQGAVEVKQISTTNLPSNNNIHTLTPPSSATS
jgi:solute carrier family 35 (UDP-galactose transporter), member B1